MLNMDLNALNTAVEKTNRRNLIITSNAAYAVSKIESDPHPIFQLGTALRMGLSDEEINDPKVISIMKWEYRTWVIGHALTDISESIASLLDYLVTLDATTLGYTGKYKTFERKGVNLKFQALKKVEIDQDYQNALECINFARNCLIHRHGIVHKNDCNGNNELLLKWIGPELSHVTPMGDVKFDKTHRGPATQNKGDMVRLNVSVIERRFPIGSRLNIEANDLSTISWCMNGVSQLIKNSIHNLVA